MYSGATLVMAVVLWTATAMVSQNMVEYGKLPMVPPQAPNPASALGSRMAAEQPSGPSGPKIIEVSPDLGKSAKKPAATQVTKASTPPPAPPKPVSTAVFILSNGDRVESSEYVLTQNSVHLTENGVKRTIPMSALNTQATVDANKQRGIDLKVPASSAEMVLAF